MSPPAPRPTPPAPPGPPPGKPAGTAVVEYPDCDGELMSDNTDQFEFIQAVQGNLDALLPDFVAGDHLWYAVEGRPDIRVAPDVYVALGRPKGYRGSYRQWQEAGVPPTVVFEWWSPNSTFPKELEKHRFYERHGVSEFYSWDQVRRIFAAFVRVGDRLDPVDTSDGWTSPLLGIRFDASAGSLRIFRADDTPFLTFRQLEAAGRAAAAERDTLAAQRDAAAARVQALADKLRALGIDPEAV